MRVVVGAMGAALMLAGCGGGTETASGPVRHQPGSWSNKVTLVSVQGIPGADNPQAKQALQGMFDMASRVGTCITPELAAVDSPAANAERLAAQGKTCTFDRKIENGTQVDIAGTCTDAAGTKMRVEIAGTNGTTAQTLTATTSPLGADNKPIGSMVIRIESRRTGECKPGDVTPPAPRATGAAQS
jgi:hypothetical protein